MEGIRLEIYLPHSPSFLVGGFYSPSSTSKYHNPYFIARFNESLDLLSTEPMEIIIPGDFNCDFLAKRSMHMECKQLK